MRHLGAMEVRISDRLSTSRSSLIFGVDLMKVMKIADYSGIEW